MSFPEIRPEDVPPPDARAILDFLNGVESVAAIAARIELPNEPDVGPRLAAHILERRAELGSFTSLDQLLTVRLIGPVRFTRIVRSLVGRHGIDPAAFEALVDEVRSLRAALDTVQAAALPPRVQLEAVGPPCYLGQPRTLVATVTGPDGLRQGGVPVTLSATWGRLRGSDAFTIQESGTITLRAAGDGTVRALLLPPTSEDLQATQQGAVEATLGRELDAGATTPEQAAEGLAALVAAYRFEANDDFRAGVDIYFRDFHEHLLDRVNFRDLLLEWSSFDSAVVAYVQELDGDGRATTGVQAAAALVIGFRDWIGPWLQTHIASTDSDDLLGGELRLATNLREPTDMLSRIHQRVGDFVSLQQGLVGQVVGRKVAEDRLGGFLESDIDRLPEPAIRALFPSLGTSTMVISALGVKGLAAVEQTRADVTRNVDARIATGIGDAVERSSAFTQLQGMVASKVDQAVFDASLAGKVDLAAFDGSLAAKVDQSTFDASLAGKVDLAAFDASLAGKVDQAAFDASLAGKVDLAAFDGSLAGKVDQAAFDASLASKVDLAAFDASLASKVDLAAFDASLAGKVDQATFDASLAGKVNQATFDATLAGKVDMSTFDAALATKIDARTLHDQLSKATDFSAFKASLVNVIRIVPRFPP